MRYAGLAAIGALGALWAQSALGSEVMRSEFRLAKVAEQCLDVRGVQVQTVRFDGLGDVGRAVIMNQVPFIIMNPVRLATLPPKLQIFFHSHECAHHVLGHPYAWSTSSEREADCWAVKHGRDSGTFSRADVVGFGPWLVGSKGSAAGHLPGPERARFLVRCFDDREDDVTAGLE